MDKLFDEWQPKFIDYFPLVLNCPFLVSSEYKTESAAQPLFIAHSFCRTGIGIMSFYDVPLSLSINSFLTIWEIFQCIQGN